MCAILVTDIEHRLSGGAANTSQAASLGGAMSTVAGGLIPDNVLNNAWDDITGAESAAGDTEFRGFYVKNNHGTLTWQNSALYVASDSLSSSTEINLAMAAEAMNVQMAGPLANESTAPSGVSFTHPTTRATGLLFNAATGLTPGSWRGYWAQRVVTAGAAALNDTVTIGAAGDTAP